ncbi:MAG: DNA-binding protein [Lachnospiraceae bacterium]|nr:DNA-binding protein [Lachnospiraceae bacterium]
MEEKVYQAYLYDFYGELLKESRRSVLEDYLFSDMSVSEIAQDKDITRQAAHDMIKRSIASLEGYEEKLGLLKKFLSAKKDIEDIEKLTTKESITKEELSKINSLAARILEDF